MGGVQQGDIRRKYDNISEEEVLDVLKLVESRKSAKLDVNAIEFLKRERGQDQMVKYNIGCVKE